MCDMLGECSIPHVCYIKNSVHFLLYWPTIERHIKNSKQRMKNNNTSGYAEKEGNKQIIL